MVVNAQVRTAPILKDFESKLYGCRFCPMCKPAGEVANLTLYETHTTRSRAMLLWRILQDTTQWTPRAVEILYQSTLDSIAEAWCVSHYPVSGYMLAARAEVYRAGLAPDTVRTALQFPTIQVEPVSGTALLILGEPAEQGDIQVGQMLTSLLQKYDIDAAALTLLSGATAYCLGAQDIALEQAQQIVSAVQSSGAQKIIADSPTTYWALTKIYPALGIRLPDSLSVDLLSVVLADALATRLSPSRLAGQSVFVHDSRSAALIADTLAKPEAIQPGFSGPEESLGTGQVYEAPRRVVDKLGAKRSYSVWSRSMSKTCGVDDGLARTYPALAAGLAQQRLAEAKRIGASVIVTDSWLSARHLQRYAAQSEISVRWLPELLLD